MAVFSRYLEQERTRKILPHLHGSVLDIGCGYNPLVRYLASGSQYVGIERDEKIVSWLRKKYPGVDFYQGDIDHQLPPSIAQYDRIVMMAVIEHLDCPEQTLASLIPFFSQDGRLVMTTPSPFGNWVHKAGAKWNLFSRLAAEEHNLIFTKTGMIELLNRAGYRLVHYETFLFFGNQLIVAEPVRRSK